MQFFGRRGTRICAAFALLHLFFLIGRLDRQNLQEIDEGDIQALDVSRRGATAWHVDRPATPLGGGAATLHYFGIKLDWIYVRGLETGESGVTHIPFSDHNSVWITARARG